jgi:hypothetical protein
MRRLLFALLAVTLFGGAVGISIHHAQAAYDYDCDEGEGGGGVGSVGACR